MIFVPKRLLCLVDLSQMSSTVLSWARLLAETYRAHVEVFHSVWTPKSDEDGSSFSFEVLGTEIEGRIHSLADGAFGSAVKYQSHVVEGHPVKMVLQYLEERPPDLIVLGSHGYDGYAQVLLGSVAENVLRAARCPMLIVKGAQLATGVHDLQAILCAVDLGDSSRQSLLTAADLARMLDADLHVAYVAPPNVPLVKASSALSSWIPDHVWSSCKVLEKVLQGDPGEMIVSYARSITADLAVLAAEHRRFLEYSTIGRTTERVVRFCPCSVLAIPKIGVKQELNILQSANA